MPESSPSRVWFITGCSSGFGLLLAHELLRRGDRVIATARDASRLDDLLTLYPDTARTLKLDVTKPAEIDASLFRSLKPGGMLAVIDEEPKAGSKPVDGVPENRGGHGVPQKILIEELTSAGFKVVRSFDNWPDSHYCVVFRKPSR